MSNPDLTDDPSQHQPSPVEEARAAAGRPPEETRAAELAAFSRLLDRTEVEYGQICDLAAKLGAPADLVTMSRNKLHDGCALLRCFLPLQV